MWDVLGIEPTNDERAVKRAYARLLKQNRPDKDPKAFQELRDAYEWCLRATRWSDYDDASGDDEFVDEVSQGDAGATESSDEHTVDAERGHEADGPLDPFVPADEKALRIIVGDNDDAGAAPIEPSARMIVNEAGSPSVPLTDPPPRIVVEEEPGSADQIGHDEEGRTEDRSSVDVVAEQIDDEAAHDDSGDAASTADPDVHTVEDAEVSTAALVAQLERSLASPERAGDENAWSTWFAATDRLSLVDREHLRMAFVDRAIDLWYDEKDTAERVLKSLPHAALRGLQDLLGWPQSEAELAEMMPDDLVLLLGELLDFEVLAVEDRLAFFQETDPGMVDAAMTPGNVRHSNGFRYGPFWCLYRKQTRRVGMAVGGPVMVSGICAGVAAAGVQVLLVIALIAIFLFYRAGGVRIWWPLLCVVLAIVTIVAFGPAGFGPALYLTFFVPLHIEAGIKGRQWREAQLNEAFSAMPANIRSDPDKRQDYLRRSGRPSKKAPTMLLAATAIVIGFIGAIGIDIYIEDNWKTPGRDLTPPTVTDTQTEMPSVPGLPDLNSILNNDERDRSNPPQQ